MGKPSPMTVKKSFSELEEIRIDIGAKPLSTIARSSPTRRLGRCVALHAPTKKRARVSNEKHLRIYRSSLFQIALH